MITLVNNDCIKHFQTIEDESIDLIISDPPYNIKFKSNRRKIKYKSIENDNNFDWLDAFVNNSYRTLKDNSHFYCFCSFHNVDIFKQAIQKHFKVKNILIWSKNNTGMGDLYCDYAPKFEMIIFAVKGKRKLNGKRDSNILEFKRTGNKLHSTQKPIDLIEYLVTKSSNVNDIVLDPFAGSGTTAIASFNTDRSCICVEMNDDCFEVMNDRVRNYKRTSSYI